MERQDQARTPFSGTLRPDLSPPISPISEHGAISFAIALKFWFLLCSILQSGVSKGSFADGQSTSHALPATTEARSPMRARWPCAKQTLLP